MFKKMIFDLSAHNTIRLWAYFEEEDFHMINSSPAKTAFDFISYWGGIDKREEGMISWEFPISLAPFFYERYCMDSRCDVEYLRRYLGK